ncbi:MAG: hypothetical protein HFH79_08800 [Lachnospiraceae bacterium]|nr:hypothetical protein [Lachnospiraceae bacterium]
MKNRIKIILIMMVAVASRAIGIGTYPIGIHADEAYAGYEAYSMLNYGVDSWGYHNLVYLTVWGSGMSVLESLFMMPFIRLGGLNLAMVRMPQMLLGVLSVFVLYLLIKKVSNQQMGLWAGFLMAVCPWHIMMSRWGLDANLAPAFILFAMYFSVLGLEKERYLIFAALFWGLSLYTYALTWIFVPVFLAVSFVYCIVYKKLKCSKYVWIFVLILGLMALPLMLFVAVNKGILPEITTSYLSIPKMAEFRSDELAFSGIVENLRDFIRIYIKQNDMNRMNTIPYFGLYYLFSLPFVVLGGWNCLSGTYKNIKNRTFGYDIFLLFWLLNCTIIGIMRSMSAYRANVMNPAVLILVIKGIYHLCQKLNREWLTRGLILLYMASFGIFEMYYFTVYQEEIKNIQNAGLAQALEYALDLQGDGDKIHVMNQIAHPKVLFYTECPVEVFRSTVTWKNYPSKWIYTESFDSFVWDEEKMEGNIFLIRSEDMERYEAAGYQTEQFEACAVAYW